MILERFSKEHSTVADFIAESTNLGSNHGTDRVMLFTGELNNGFVKSECERLATAPIEPLRKALKQSDKVQVTLECEQYVLDDFYELLEECELSYAVFSPYCAVLRTYGEGVGDFDVLEHLEFDILVDADTRKAVAIRVYLEGSYGIDYVKGEGLNSYKITNRYDNPLHDNMEAMNGLAALLSDHIEYFANALIKGAEKKPFALGQIERDTFHRYDA